MVVLFCVGCRAVSEDSTPEIARGGTVAGEGRSNTIKADNLPVLGAAADLPVAKPAKWTSHLEYCDHGFRPTGDVRIDLARLGALCGPSNGLTRATSVQRQLQLPGDDPVPPTVTARLRGRHEPGTCGRLAVAVAPAFGAVVVQLQAEETSQILAECRLSKSGFCPPREVVCGAAVAAVQSDVDSKDDAMTTKPERRSPSTEVEATTAGATKSHDAPLVLTVAMEWWALPQGVVPTPSSLPSP